MIVDIDIQTFVSPRKPGSQLRKDPDEILQGIRDALIEEIRMEVYSYRSDGRMREKEMDTPTLLVRPELSKSRGLGLPDIWVRITTQRSEVSEHNPGDLHNSLSQIVLDAFDSHGFEIRVDLDLTDTQTNLYTPTLVPN
jgi:hypothetical protein